MLRSLGIGSIDGKMAFTHAGSDVAMATMTPREELRFACGCTTVNSGIPFAYGLYHLARWLLICAVSFGCAENGFPLPLLALLVPFLAFPIMAYRMRHEIDASFTSNAARAFIWFLLTTLPFLL